MGQSYRNCEAAPYRRRAPAAALAALTLALGGCVAAPPPLAGAPFDPERYFFGSLHSHGELALGPGAPRALQVASLGRSEAGGLRLDQTIRWAGGKVDRRYWTMRRRADGGWSVDLSDAAGPVDLEAAGSRVHLRYRIRGAPASMEQWMDLEADGRTVRNVGVVRMLGVPVGRLSETIVHDPF